MFYPPRCVWNWCSSVVILPYEGFESFRCGGDVFLVFVELLEGGLAGLCFTNSELSFGWCAGGVADGGFINPGGEVHVSPLDADLVADVYLVAELVGAGVGEFE